MRTRSLRRAFLAVMVAATVAVAPAALAQDGTLPFAIDTARLAADRHTVVVAGTYTCGPLTRPCGRRRLTSGRAAPRSLCPDHTCDGTAQAFRRGGLQQHRS